MGVSQGDVTVTEMDERLHSITGDVTLLDVIMEDVHPDSDLHEDSEAAVGMTILAAFYITF